MNTRRSALLQLLSGAAIAVFRPSFARAAGQPKAAPADPVHGPLLGPFGPGADVAYGWRVDSVGAVVNGASLVILKHDDHGSAHLRVCRREPSHPLGIAQTGELDIVLLNEGNGRHSTEPTLAAAVAHMATVIVTQERHSPVHDQLRTHDEHLRLCDVKKDQPA